MSKPIQNRSTINIDLSGRKEGPKLPKYLEPKSFYYLSRSTIPGLWYVTPSGKRLNRMSQRYRISDPVCYKCESDETFGVWHVVKHNSKAKTWCGFCN